jgi:hypothetical protein
MKRKRSIVIKDPQLKKIRNNLRMLIIKWALDEWKKLHSKLSGISSDEVELIRKINGEKQIVIKKLDASICLCASCSAPNKDMTFNPANKRWYCVDCYMDLQDFYKDKQESFLYP